ncbi:MAG TPA: DUF4198 domain-containing protein [Steroidobacteraceae bacterium]
MHRMIKFATLAAIASLPVAAHAHKPWLLPSVTVSTPDQWVTVDAAVSDNLFYFDHVPLRVDSLAITAPDGSSPAPENVATGKYRTTFDLHLTANGTYRLANLSNGVFASYEENGTTKRWRGTAEKFATEVPANAKNLQVSESTGRVETFVTAGKPTTAALKPTNVGLELVPITHPNDLYAGEPTQFRFLLDGKPAANLPITVIAGGVRYRDSQDEIKLVTDTKGEVSITWPAPGMYWLQSSLQDDKTSLKQAKQRRVSYSATLEVLPQ